MYIWTALDVSDALSSLRERAALENAAIGLSEVAFTLPAHISLKISFSVADALTERVMARLMDFLKKQPIRSVRVRGIEQNGGILWVRMADETWLSQLHQELDEMLFSEFSVEQHPFDRAFCFHATLFLDSDRDKAALMKKALSDARLPDSITPSGYLIGVSSEGTAGSYRVACELKGEIAV